MARKYCHVECQSSAVNVNGKVNILLQTYLARGRAKSFSLISDLVYISQVNLKFILIIYILLLFFNKKMYKYLFLIECDKNCKGII